MEAAVPLVLLLAKHVHHWWSLMKVGVLLTQLRSLILVAVLTLIMLVAKVFVSLLNGEEDLATFIAQLHPLDPKAVLIIHLPLGSLSMFHLEVVNEGMRPILGVGLSLFHPDCSHASILGKDLLEGALVRQL